MDGGTLEGLPEGSKRAQGVGRLESCGKGGGMSEATMTRDEALRLIAENPSGLISHFNFSSAQVLKAMAEVGVEEMRKELGGSLVDWFPLSLSQASFVAGGASRETLLRGEHHDFGDRKKSVSLGAALRLADKSKENEIPALTPEEKILLLRRELAAMEAEVARRAS